LKSKGIMTKSRSSTILPNFIGKQILVHNGLKFVGPIHITSHHVGHKLGEFAPTKKPAVYKRTKTTKKK